ncbi:MAG: hypothetical protein GXZ15_06255 [Campylobacter sp.]|nr:hypothetical protein [Campylobacter sp.]
MILDDKFSELTTITCEDALNISKELNIAPNEVGKVATLKDIRIKDCLFGEFGKFSKAEGASGHINLYELIKPHMDIHRRVSCSLLLELSQEYGVENIRGCLEEFGVKVKSCSLGLFKEKSEKKLFLNVKTWVENESGEVIFSKDSNQSLDMIAKTGSIQKASDLLDINYKKCWTHLKNFEKSMGEKVALTRRGAGDDAGTIMNKKALDWVDKYKNFQRAVDEFATEKFNEIFFEDEKIEL